VDIQVRDYFNLTPDDFTHQQKGTSSLLNKVENKLNSVIVVIQSQTGCSLARNIAILSHNIAILIGSLL
jgi:hypothetical protein